MGEVGAEVAPSGIGAFDQKDFFLAAPAFELLFAGEGVANVGKGLEVDEFGRIVLRAEAGEELLFVLRDAGFEVAGDAGVEDTGGAGHDIDVVNHGRVWLRLYTRRGKREERSLHCGRDDGALEVGEGGGFGGVVVEEAEEAGDFQSAAEVGAEIREAEARALGYYFAMGLDQGAEAGAVHIGDVFEIDDDASGASGKKIVNGGAKADALFAERQTTAEGQKIEAIRFALRDFQSHRELSHAPI